MLDSKKSDEPLPKHIEQAQTDWLLINNHLFGLLQSKKLKVFLFLLTTILTCLTIAFLLLLSTTISGYNKENLNSSVDIKKCKCNCWDGFYRGLFPRTSENTEYKIFYFNYRIEMIYIIFVFLFYAELLKVFLTKLINLLLNDGIKSIRLGVLFVLILNLYANYNDAWHLLNYLNDSFYRSFKNQLFHSVLNILPSFIYYQNLEKFNSKIGNYKPITNSSAIAVLGITLLSMSLTLPIKWKMGLFRTLGLEPDRLLDAFLLLRDLSALVFSYVSLKRYKKFVLSNVRREEIGTRENFFYYKTWLISSIVLYLIKILLF